MYALDTNSLIHFFKGVGNVGARLAECSPAQVGIPIIVVYEIETGIAKSSQPQKRRRQFSSLLDSVRVLPFDAEAARRSAVVRAKMESEGTPIGPLDTLIAGIALAQRATLVTRNTREFGRVPGLALEDWS